MDLHLDRLTEMHPLLPQITILELIHRAAVGLRRHNHVSGVSLKLSLNEKAQPANLHWTHTNDDDGLQLDFHRVTEDTAEAVALTVANETDGWVVRRRLQRGEFADWLLADRNDNLVYLEVSGIDKIDIAMRRMAMKIDQVGKVTAKGTRAACVVELQPPRCRMAMV
jgi:hypothetical protein